MHVIDSLVKFCHESAQWAGKDENDYSKPYGFTNFAPCMLFDPEIIEVSKQKNNIRYSTLSLNHEE